MGAKGSKGISEKPNRTSVILRVKKVQGTSDFPSSNERVSYAGLCAWLQYGG